MVPAPAEPKTGPAAPAVPRRLSESERERASAARKALAGARSLADLEAVLATAEPLAAARPDRDAAALASTGLSDLPRTPFVEAYLDRFEAARQ
jgi:hypothetical protein